MWAVWPRSSQLYDPPVLSHPRASLFTSNPNIPQLRLPHWRMNLSLIPKRTQKCPYLLVPSATMSKIMLSRPSSGVRQHCTAPRRCLAAPGADSGDPWGLESLLAGALLPFFVCVYTTQLRSLTVQHLLSQAVGLQICRGYTIFAAQSLCHPWLRIQVDDVRLFALWWLP